MHVLLIAFVASAGVLWLSVFGYVSVLAVLALRRRAARQRIGELPALTVVVPTRNEAAHIDAKLDDLRRSDYPAERLRVVVVDGGSTDGTIERVEVHRRRDPRIELVCVAGARSKSAQLNAVLPLVRDELIVVTDADTALDPSCVRELVGALTSDPSASVAGARVRPASRLLEERLHWWLLNRLWWLEGEALGIAGFSGVCYGLRRSAVIPLPSDCTAEDIALGMAAAARGGRAILCRSALASELRVPQTVWEFLRFRRRRGKGYLGELLRRRPAGASRGWRAVRAVRLFHFLIMPPLAAAVVAGGIVLSATSHWQWPAGIAVLFAAPVLIALGLSTTLGSHRWWRLGLAAGCLAGLTWVSLLGLPLADQAPLAGE